MAKRVSFSGQHFSIAQAAIHHIDVDASLGLFFSIGSPSYPIRFAGYRIDEVGMELRERLAELDRNSTMSLIAAVEAAFRIDYLQRCYRKERDEVSRLFREIYREKAANASLEREIFEVWKNNTVGGAGIIGDLRGAFKFRHWIAHGRYWTPKLGCKYDYLSVYALVANALAVFPLLTA